MNARVRRFFSGNSTLRWVYIIAWTTYHRRRIAKAAKVYFVNVTDYQRALEARSSQ